jgi:hypothetical protein
MDYHITVFCCLAVLSFHRTWQRRPGDFPDLGPKTRASLLLDPSDNLCQRHYARLYPDLRFFRRRELASDVSLDQARHPVPVHLH